MKKGSLLLIVLLLICLLLSGCGKTENTVPATQGETVTQGDQTAPAAAEKADPSATSATDEYLPDDGPAPAESEPLVEYGEPSISQWAEWNADEPNFQIMVPVTNISGDDLSLRTAVYTLKDKDGSEVAVFENADCAPIFLEPGQSGIIYYTSYNRSGLDYLNPDYTLEFEAEFFPMDGGTIIPLQVKDVQFTKDMESIEITGSLVNDTEYDFDFPYASFLFRNEDGDILCGAFCMGGNSDFNSEDFGKQPAGTTMPFRSYRYWLPDDYPLEKASIEAFGFGLHY